MSNDKKDFEPTDQFYIWLAEKHAREQLEVLVALIVDATTYDDEHKEYLYDQIMESLAGDFGRTMDVIDSATTLLTEESNDE